MVDLVNNQTNPLPRTCIYCGESINFDELGPDHFYPRALLGPSTIRKRQEFEHLNPLAGVVNQAANIFNYCPSRHQSIDAAKLQAFLPITRTRGEKQAQLTQPFRGNPVGLLEYFRFKFELTKNPGYRRRQIRYIRRTTGLYITAVEKMTADDMVKLQKYYGHSQRLPQKLLHPAAEKLVIEYKESLKIAKDYIEYLEGLTYWLVSYPSVSRFPVRDFLN